MSDNWKIEGTVVENGTPVQRVVRVYRRDTGALLGEMTSNPDGTFLINMLYGGLVYAVALDDDLGADYNALIFDRLSPVYAPMPDSVNLVPGKTATAIASQSGYGPEKAIDGNSGTYWGKGGAAPGWWQVDLGAVFNITKIVWANSNNQYTYIGNMQGSDDGVNWTNLFSFDTTGQATITYNGSWSARFIRWDCTSSSGGYLGWLSISEFEVWGY